MQIGAEQISPRHNKKYRVNCFINEELSWVDKYGYAILVGWPVRAISGRLLRIVFVGEAARRFPFFRE